MPFIDMPTDDLRYVLSRLPQDLRRLVKQHRLFVAGGFIRAMLGNEQPNDIDILGPDKATLILVADTLREAYGGRTVTSDNAITVLAPGRLPVQFITRWLYAAAEHDRLLAEFDFTIAQAVVFPTTLPITGGDIWQGRMSDRFYMDLAARRLVYTEPVRHEDAGGSTLRVCKFLARGYRIPPEQLGRVLGQFVDGAGIETWKRDFPHRPVSQLLINRLREVDPMTLIDGVEAVPEDHHMAQVGLALEDTPKRLLEYEPVGEPS